MSADTSAGAAAGSNGAAKVPDQPRTIVVEAADLEAGRAASAQQLSVPAEELSVRVLSRRRKGFLGLGGESVQVEATWVPPAPTVPGRIELACLMGRLSLAVFPPEARGKPADVALLDALVAGWPLDARDETVVSAALWAADGRPRVFATMSPSIPSPGEAPVAAKVAADELTAWLVPWADAEADQEALQAALAAAGVTAGVDEARLDALAGTKLKTPLVIAKGRPARDGIDAKADYVLEQLAAERGPADVDGGHVDYRELGGTPTVEPGEVLVRKVPAVPGEDGLTVRGKVLAAKPARDLDLERLVGQNTAVNEDGTALVARTGGLPSRAGDRVVVLPLYSVRGDVDFSVGNLDFEGNLAIAGGVKPGFKLRATGSIQIGGTVEAATIEAGGDVIVRGGIVGHHEGVVRAGGAVAARFVEAAEIHAGGPVTIGSEIRQSTVVSEKTVTVAGQGRIVGGLVRGRDAVEASVLGSPSGSPTVVQAGWGEELAVDASGSTRVPRVVAKGEVNTGVVVTVAGATQRITRPSAGGVWREVEGKLQHTAS